MTKSKIKICGIKTIKTLQCCINNKIDFFGLVFYEKSPRNISIKRALKIINYVQNKEILSVGVFVNKSIKDIENILKFLDFNYIQLHGNENNDYIKSIKRNYNTEVIKAISIQNIRDLEKISDYPNADCFLFDYKPQNNELPGGNAKKFDWELLKDVNINKKWFISGGINIKNIGDINKYAIPYGIDISSGVEYKKGIKSNDKIISLKKFYEKK